MVEPASASAGIPSGPAPASSRSRPIRKWSIKVKAAVKKIFEQESSSGSSYIPGENSYMASMESKNSIIFLV